MYSSKLENQLIFPDIADIMEQYVSIQRDIDEIKVKAACIMAQKIDIKRLIGSTNLLRVIEQEGVEMSDADLELKDLLEAPVSYFTYYRLLMSFHSSYSDSGFETDETGASRNEAKSVAKEIHSVGEVFMEDVITFLDAESPDSPIDQSKLSASIRVFGGCETRSSN